MQIPLFETPPRLKSLELQGYKTFASKTLFAFAPTITSVVGPNGSGKSNIADAIRWVLGEQAYGLLRGKKTEDMIFSGSETRARASMASATITFDNSDGWLPIEFSEVTISRRAYRDGQNEYLINGQRVRLRDVTELLAKCGLSQRTYTIIGQGLVDAALSLKAEERRRLFEEAAGIGLYRGRRSEARRRLEATQRNLERVQDILAELKPHLRSIERQAKRAEQYHTVRNDLQQALLLWHGYHWHQAQAAYAGVRNQVGELTRLRDAARESQQGMEARISALRLQISEKRQQLQQRTQQVSSHFSDREQHGRRLAIAQERQRWLQEQQAFMAAEIESLQRQQAELAATLAQAQTALEERNLSLSEAQSALAQLEAEGGLGTRARKNLQDRSQQLQTQLETLVADRASRTTQLEQLAQRRATLEGRLVELDEALAASTENVAQAEEKLRVTQQAVEEAGKRLIEARRTLSEREARLAAVQKAIKNNEAESSSLFARSSSMEARLDVLRRAPTGARNAADDLLKAARRGDLPGLVGKLRETLRIPPELREGVAAVLGEFSQALTFETMDDVGSALLWLEKHAAGDQAALVALPDQKSPTMLKAPDDPDCLGVAAELVDADPIRRPLVNLLLGRTLVVRSRAAARRLLTGLPADARIVTLAGEVYYPFGLVLAAGRAEAGSKASRIEKFEQQLADLLKQAEQAMQEASGLRSELDQALEDRRLALAEAETASAGERDAHVSLATIKSETRSVHAEHTYLISEKKAAQGEFERLVSQRERTSEQVEGFELQRSSLQAELLQIQAQLSTTTGAGHMAQAEARIQTAMNGVEEARRKVIELQENRRTALERELADWQRRAQANQSEQARLQEEIAEAGTRLAGVEGQLGTINAQISVVESSLQQLEGERSALEADETRKRLDLQTAERRYSQVQIELARREEEVASLKRRIDDDFGLVSFPAASEVTTQEPLPLEGIVETLPRVEQLPPDLGNQVSQLRAQLRRMGPVNPDAQTEFHQVEERVTFLTEQLDDLRSAEGKIEEVIAELDLVMEREFRKTFDAVAVEFREAFTRLFGGGTARLTMIEDGNLEEAGIDIEARLPGRREQGLSMLSGGERSLTASALVFALLKVAPTPFCVLDEVDAMLDESNVVRYNNMLKELSAETQFILITHNRHTVQQAEAVYGISMGPDSASRVISIKMDGVEQAAE